MFGITLKLTAKKILCLGLFFLIILMIYFAVYQFDDAKTHIVNAKTKSERIAFLADFGWECDENDETVKNSVIPEEFDEVFQSYNELQKSQGYDLSNFKGKSVKIYSIRVLNYPENSEYVYASLTVCDDKIIGGDIHSTALNGFMHGFSLKNTGKDF